MMGPILEFLDGRKTLRLKKPGNRTAEEIDQEFEPINWITNAASRAKQLSLVSHPGKFSHPDAKITPIHAAISPAADGYVRTGNVTVPVDVLGNAAALDVYAFLMLGSENGKTVLELFESSNEAFRSALNVDEELFKAWRTGLLAITSSDEPSRTDGSVKQVYFPVDDDYHLLSILTPSGLVRENRERLREMKFSEATKAARDAKKKDEPSPTGYDDLFGQLTMHYGGTQPQNVSKLNSANAGEAWLLPSLPPSFATDYTRKPKKDFFDELRYDRELYFRLDGLHRTFIDQRSNVDIRDRRKRQCVGIFDWVFDRAAIIQALDAGWSDHESVRLPRSQRIWLDQQFAEARDDEDEWIEEICQSLAHWLIVTYRRRRKRAYDEAPLGTGELAAFASEVEGYAKAEREILR
ncbi:type I-F CRISPR-associated protein Csy1 [Rhodopirellula europaea]|uniref:type I-F CRISPR-associated protein Csy1 n=1 Tax=Rhodopirellula europaea TaxID=1263866 RepID=UPI003D28E353|tara:strand:+ start:9646 stop:10872 length:1227 start_codon:yes stop_codon:yes gene_type:complete